jgi:hypothetical protein
MQAVGRPLTGARRDHIRVRSKNIDRFGLARVGDENSLPPVLKHDLFSGS